MLEGNHMKKADKELSVFQLLLVHTPFSLLSVCERERESENESVTACETEGEVNTRRTWKRAVQLAITYTPKHLGAQVSQASAPELFIELLLSVKSFITCWIADYILQEPTAWGSQLEAGGMFLKSIFLNIWVELIEEVNFFLFWAVSQLLMIISRWASCVPRLAVFCLACVWFLWW